jgi:hypothetical protein
MAINVKWPFEHFSSSGFFFETGEMAERSKAPD